MSGKYLLGNMLSALYNKNCFYDRPVQVVYSGLCEGVLKLMQDGGYVNKYAIVTENGKKSINIWLQISGGKKNINSFKLISKPGCRVYLSAHDLRKKILYNKFVLLLVSTSSGIMDATEAVKNNIGGEVLCQIF